MDRTKLWCPNCARREKAEADWDENGGDFWWCTAQPVLPEYAGVFLNGNMTGRVGVPINLKLFEDGTTYRDGLVKRT